MEIIFVMAGVFLILLVVKIKNAVQAKRRRDYLLDKYGDAELVDRLIAKYIWEGMTQEQLLDSWGPPVATEEKVYKTKTKETWKYGQTGRNRFHNRVTVENKMVVGWTKK